jgi:hypothetical protein
VPGVPDRSSYSRRPAVAGADLSRPESVERMAFEMFDTVRLVDIIARRRVMDDSVGSGEAPQLGETGTVVEIISDGLYLVECNEDDGDARWIGEFLEDELESAS